MLGTAFGTLRHRREVFKLYRRALKTAEDHSATRDVFCELSLNIRDEFNENKNENNVVTIEYLKAMTDYWITFYKSGTAYTKPYEEDGSAWCRNIPLSPGMIEIHSQLTDHPEYFTI